MVNLRELCRWLWEKLEQLLAGLRHPFPVSGPDPTITYLYNPGQPAGIKQEGTWEPASGSGTGSECAAWIGKDVVTIGGANFGTQPGNQGYVTLEDSAKNVFGGVIPQASGEESNPDFAVVG